MTTLLFGKPKMQRTKPYLDTCEHGRFYSLCWEWDDTKGETVEDSVPVILSNKCLLCNRESIS